MLPLTFLKNYPPLLHQLSYTKCLATSSNNTTYQREQMHTPEVVVSPACIILYDAEDVEDPGNEEKLAGSSFY